MLDHRGSILSGPCFPFIGKRAIENGAMVAKARLVGRRIIIIDSNHTGARHEAVSEDDGAFVLERREVGQETVER
jgi:hypothetical protein